MIRIGARAALGRPVSDLREEDEALDEFSDEELERYARHIVLPELGARGQLKLKNATVALVGMGGIGCPTAQALAQAGIGHLILIDPDTVDLSNLPRQPLFRASDIGRPKALVAAEVLEESRPNLSTTVHVAPLRERNVESLLGGAKVVIDGTDNFATRSIVADFCQEEGQCLVSAAVTGTEGQIMCLDGETGRYTALFPEGPPPQQNCAEAGVLATSSMLLGQLAAQTAIQWLVTGERPMSQLVSTWPLRIMRLTV